MHPESPQNSLQLFSRQIETVAEFSMNTLLPAAPNPELQGKAGEWIASSQTALAWREDHGTASLQAILWILADDLERAHRICQDIPTPLGAACHAVVHRRDGDFWNSKYWWRRTAPLAPSPDPSNHVHTLLSTAPTPLQHWHYTPADFVDLVQQHHHSSDPHLLRTLLQIQRAEWRWLFHECLHTVGG